MKIRATTGKASPARVRDLGAAVEMAGPYLSEGQIGQVIELVFRLAGDGAGKGPIEVERRRIERDVSSVPPAEREPA